MMLHLSAFSNMPSGPRKRRAARKKQQTSESSTDHLRSSFVPAIHPPTGFVPHLKEDHILGEDEVHRESANEEDEVHRESSTTYMNKVSMALDVVKDEVTQVSMALDVLEDEVTQVSMALDVVEDELRLPQVRRRSSWMSCCGVVEILKGLMKVCEECYSYF